MSDLQEADLTLLAFPPRTRTLQNHQYMICYVILTVALVSMAVLCEPLPCLNGAFLEMWPVRGQRGQRGALKRLLCFFYNHCGDSFAGKFREKASILHKIAKKKCQVEDSEKANGVASRSGKRFPAESMMLRDQKGDDTWGYPANGVKILFSVIKTFYLICFIPTKRRYKSSSLCFLFRLNRLNSSQL